MPSSMQKRHIATHSGHSRPCRAPVLRQERQDQDLGGIGGVAQVQLRPHGPVRKRIQTAPPHQLQPPCHHFPHPRVEVDGTGGVLPQRFPRPPALRAGDLLEQPDQSLHVLRSVQSHHRVRLFTCVIDAHFLLPRHGQLARKASGGSHSKDSAQVQYTP